MHRSRQIVAAELPTATVTRFCGRKKRIEIDTDRGIHAAGAGTGVRRVCDVALARGIGVGLDPRKICLERDTIEVFGILLLAGPCI